MDCIVAGDMVQVVYVAGTDTSPVFGSTNNYWNGFNGFRIWSAVQKEEKDLRINWLQLLILLVLLVANKLTSRIAWTGLDSSRIESVLHSVQCILSRLNHFYPNEFYKTFAIKFKVYSPQIPYCPHTPVFRLWTLFCQIWQYCVNWVIKLRKKCILPIP